MPPKINIFPHFYDRIPILRLNWTTLLKLSYERVHNHFNTPWRYKLSSSRFKTESHPGSRPNRVQVQDWIVYRFETESRPGLRPNHVQVWDRIGSMLETESRPGLRPNRAQVWDRITFRFETESRSGLRPNCIQVWDRIGFRFETKLDQRNGFFFTFGYSDETIALVWSINSFPRVWENGSLHQSKPIKY